MKQSKSSRRSLARNSAGFTLVELMVVVAIVGVLVGVAIPNYRKFTNRARQTEAKIALGAIYTAEKSFAAEQSSYTTCLRNAGFVPEGAHRYFAVGFNHVAGNNVCGRNNDRVCNGFAYGEADPAPVATYTVNDTTCAAGMGDPATPTVAMAYGANVKGNSSAALPAVSPDEDTAFGGAGACSVSRATFTACAAGALEGANYDRWTMTEAGEITNVANNI